jgi:hypothetical protein
MFSRLSILGYIDLGLAFSEGTVIPPRMKTRSMIRTFFKLKVIKKNVNMFHEIFTKDLRNGLVSVLVILPFCIYHWNKPNR